MSNRIDRDVINALISGHFADPFPYLACIKPMPGWKYAHYYPMPPMYGLLNRKPGAKSASSNASTHADSLAAFCRGEKILSLPAGGHRHGQQNLIDDPYRFGPLLQDLDVWLLSEGTHLRPYETLGRTPTRWTASPARAFPSGRRTPVGFPLSGSSTIGMAAAIRCACAKSPASGSCLCLGRIMASCINLN